ncbi:uncharacterized protein F5147DRAFT_839271 [Suillus discolor]|uniref:Uncharacterized protein n=1 Tax=Suillus discolor TaxID=1912936 RepID=A0A9P7F184_9AGAM|nr:uncharacterized protein F5147DRAFT_839271 [Suillus discolor]KAG2100195.1 hypothetical protein F5147DRAFT_839271 [Suillus discolor]
MPITSPTLVPRPPIIPVVLPRAPQVNPTPLPKLDRHPGRMDTRHDLQREIDDLSDEENELEDSESRVPVARSYWAEHDAVGEEQMPGFSCFVEDDSDGADTGQSGGGPSMNEDGEENDDSGADLDASMDDMDDEGETGTANEAEDANDMTNDFEERSSDA